MLAIFSTTMVSISLSGKELPPRSVVAPGRSFALKAETAEHVRQWKDTLAKMEHGDPVPWPMFVDFIRLRHTSASHCTCGAFQVLGLCEEILLWLILKEPQFQVLLL